LSPPDIFANALARMLESAAVAEVVGFGDEEQECLQRIAHHSADILIVNSKCLRYPLSGFFEGFRAQLPALRVMVFGHEDHDVFVRNLVRAGCCGFINDEITQEGLREALDTVMEGKLWVDRGLLSQIAVEGFELQRMIEQRIRERIGLLNEELSAREADVFSLALDGLSTQEVADTLHLSKQSVKVYLHRLFLKFGVNNRAKLIVAAFVRVCPVDHLIQLLRRNLGHTDNWRRSCAREAQSPEERAEP